MDEYGKDGSFVVTPADEAEMMTWIPQVIVDDMDTKRLPFTLENMAVIGRQCGIPKLADDPKVTLQ